MDIINVFIFFLICLFIFLIMNNQIVREGMSQTTVKKTTKMTGSSSTEPSPNPQPYAVGPDPPSHPPPFKETQNQNPKAKAAAAARKKAKEDGLSEEEQDAAAANATKNVDSGPGEAPSYCGCVNSNTQTLYNQNLDLLSELKKKISKFTEDVKKSNSQVQANSSDISKSKKDDFKMCCTGGGDKRDEDGDIQMGLCRRVNKYKCPAPPKDDEEEEEEDENLPSSKPTPEQVKNG